MIGVAVVGLGYWGPNLLRNFADAEGSRVVAACDRDPARLAAVGARYPAVELFQDLDAVLEDRRVDAVAIATPASTHHALAMRALRAGKHVLVEKPLARTAEEAREIADEAARRGLTLLVDHTFIYTGAVRRIRQLIEADDIGDLYYYDAVRVNLGLFRHDVNVLWDLAVHDLAILDYLIPRRPVGVAAHGLGHISGQFEDIAYLTLFFDGPFIAHVHVNWLAPVKVRRTLIGGSRRMVVYDDLEPDQKIKIFDAGVSLRGAATMARRMMLEYRLGDMLAPQVDRTEALRNEVGHFLACIRSGSQPDMDGASGVRVVEMLQAADASIARGGARVALASPAPV